MHFVGKQKNFRFEKNKVSTKSFFNKIFKFLKKFIWKEIKQSKFNTTNLKGLSISTLVITIVLVLVILVVISKKQRKFIKK
jgi:hypothetical protein